MKNEMPIVSPSNLSIIVTKVEKQLKVVDKLLHQDSPLTLDWWNNLPEEWKAIFSFYIKFKSEYTDDFHSFDIIWAWYNEDLTSLKRLEENNHVITSDIPFGMPKIDKLFLEELYLIDNISISNSNIKDISPLSNLINLANLDLSLNYIDDIKPLKKLSNLKYLNLGYHNLTNLETLKYLSSLEELDLSCGVVNSLDCLSCLTKLSTLNLQCSCIEILNIPTTLVNLYELNLDDNNISDLRGLVGLINLRTLILSHNKICDISPLSELKSLQHIDLQENNINYKAISKFKKMRPNVLTFR